MMKKPLSPLGSFVARDTPVARIDARVKIVLLLALTVAVSIGQGEDVLLSLLAAGLPAVFSVSALLAACAMVWQSGEAAGRYSLRACRVQYALCVLIAMLSALLRAGIAAAALV